MSEESSYKLYGETELRSVTLIAGWNEDGGRLGSKVADYLNRALGGRECAEIEPAGFFALGGVSIENDVAQFPESKFYCCQEKNLVIFKSNSPGSDWYRFLNLVLDVAEHHGKVSELYTIGGMVSVRPHTSQRELLAVSSYPEMKEVLSRYDLINDMDYETSPGQRPTLSSFLLWAARRRGIAGVSLWVSIPFYLVTIDDPQAWRRMLGFFDQRFGLGLDFKDLDEEVARQDEKIARLRNRFPELDSYISRLESDLSLTEQENSELIGKMEQLLGRGDISD